MKVLFIVPYPLGVAPSQRFRFEQYFSIAAAAGIEITVSPFWSPAGWGSLYKKGRSLSKAGALLSGLGRRTVLVWKARGYDRVFIHREALPLGPPLLEWWIARILRKKIIFDFDDAIWLPNTSKENAIVSSLKWHSKTGSICKWSHKVSCGNAYLAEYAKRFNPSVVINPSTVDTENLHNAALRRKRETNETITIGWTGSHSTVKYLSFLEPILRRLADAHPSLRIAVVADKAPPFEIAGMTFIPWNKNSEIEDLLTFDIGVMPLSDDAWSRGKCGFKALQYMALGITPVISPVGVNLEIVDDGVNGYLCTSEAEWEERLTRLIQTPELRASMGTRARQKIIDRYSVISNSSTFLSLFGSSINVNPTKK